MPTNLVVSRRRVLATGLAIGAGLLIPAAPTPILPGGVRAGDRRAASNLADTSTDLLIIGAGPFGLSLAAYAQVMGIRHMAVGAAMGFW